MPVKVTMIGQGILIEWNDGTFEYLTDFEVEARKIAVKKR